MSDSEEQLNEFEQLLGSVPLAEPLGNPMQIMYLAGQQSKAGSTQPTSVRLWQWTTFASSAIAAGLLLMLAMPAASDVTPNTVASNVGAALDQPETTDDSARQSVAPRSLIRPPRPSLIEMAQSRLPKSSVDMFGDFDLKPIDEELFKKEFFE